MLLFQIPMVSQLRYAVADQSEGLRFFLLVTRIAAFEQLGGTCKRSTATGSHTLSCPALLGSSWTSLAE